jgi:hypothetical protein
VTVDFCWRDQGRWTGDSAGELIGMAGALLSRSSRHMVDLSEDCLIKAMKTSVGIYEIPLIPRNYYHELATVGKTTKRLETV